MLNAVASALFVILVDQAAKTLVRLALPICPDEPTLACERIGLVGPIGLLRTENPGTALGLLGGDALGVLVPLAFVLVAVQAVRVCLTPLAATALGLEVGGMLGNLIDRILFGAVTDFVHMPFGGPASGLVFNPADVGLVLGGAILGYLALQTHRPGQGRGPAPDRGSDVGGRSGSGGRVGAGSRSRA